MAGLTRLVLERGRPKTLKVDNGPEFAGRLLDQWAHLNGAEIDSSRPGKPTDNAHIEAFNARLRAECLNASWFLSVADARDRLEAWRREYNEERPHGSLRNLTPRAFAEQAQLSSGLPALQRMAVALRVDLGDRVVDGAVKAIRAGEGLMGQMMPLQVAPDAKVST